MCFHEIFDEDAFNLIMLRNPLSHVLSQFQECKYDPFFVKETRNTDFPQNASDEKGFKKWVSFFNDNWEIEEGDFNCYNPWVIISTIFCIILTNSFHMKALTKTNGVMLRILWQEF